MKGYHFILDAECRDKKKLGDQELINRILLELPMLVGMNRIIEPLIVKGASYNPGLTGVVILETSNILIHTFTKENKISIDIFSIKEIDEQAVTSYLNRFFNLKVIRQNLVDRL
ncbi:MAG: S-adenosylmethionine decarboxylase [Nanoarchaeota archaeon]|nr:S-adenosylmethionine decarboxylase [Nanoarchaeota archaeon]